MRPIAKRAERPLARVTLPPGEDPWQRLKGEPQRPRDAFLAYLALGSARTLARLAETTATPLGTACRWSSAYLWLERADAYDASVLTLHQERMAERGRAMVDRQTEQGERVEVALLEQVLTDVAAGRLDAKEALTGWLGARKDNRAAVGLEGRGSGGGGGTTVNVAVQLGAVDERLESFTGRLRTALDGAGLTPDQWARLEAGMRED